MTMTVAPIPDGYTAATPYLSVHNAAQAIAFYQEAFGATEQVRLTDPTGKIAHAEIKIGSAAIMLADEYPDMGFRSAQTLGGTAVSLLLYVQDADAVMNRAIAAGATVVRPVVDQFYGDLVGTIADPFGHHWMIATRIEAVSPDEMQRRFNAMFSDERLEEL
jgi:PhnB protein